MFTVLQPSSSRSHSSSTYSDMEHDLDLDVGFDVGFDLSMTKDDLLLSTLTPSSSCSSLYQLQDQPHLYRRGRGLAYGTITTTTTVTTTTTTTPSTPAQPSSSASSSLSRISGASISTGFQEDRSEANLPLFPGALQLVSEGPYLFIFDIPISLYYPIRALILFMLGFMFSLVIDHLQTQHNLIQYPRNAHHYLWDTASWLPPTCGLSAVLIGTFYPLGDYLWWGQRVKQGNQDWSSVMRCFGGFIGVNYAASRLPWTSSLQVSCTLALISVGLWFWFDRTFHGFMISLTVASIGTLVAYFLVLNGWYSFTRADFYGVGSWMPCILYSSSVCFGSIGRQLDVVPATWYDSSSTQTHVKTN
ncbi:insulin-induced protein-domain-containing protein [Gamsiella multidivaricata]|uniref:insulin-induced protein-domain-containing protein n=1 Tax=Gamsiella multidivaricata TaxID=101098 RepID=UPI00221F3223|nr:insulin-induced protein-domain-containing protein [Gamsiella multidivaricata]KAI7821572.1 insulin-induced protein-domain-containing protein [Gamsiella multidivaricata]